MNKASKHYISIEICSWVYGLNEFGINKFKCIGEILIFKGIGYEVNANKDDT